MKKIILSKKQMSGLYGGDPVIDSPGKEKPQPDGCTIRYDDGFNDDDGDGKQSCDEKSFTSITQTCPNPC